MNKEENILWNGTKDNTKPGDLGKRRIKILKLLCTEINLKY